MRGLGLKSPGFWPGVLRGLGLGGERVRVRSLQGSGQVF